MNVLIVEDEPLIAEDMACHLQSLGYNVVGILESGEDAMDELKRLKPDVVLLDITLSGEKSGIDVAEFINSEIQIPFIFMTSHADRDTINQVKKVHPGGYVIKPCTEQDLFVAIELGVSNFLAEHQSRGAVTLNWINSKLDTHLSEREFEVLMALKDGKTNSQLADSLFLSVNTVKTHLQRIYDKLHVSNRTGAIFKIHQLINSS